MTTTAIAPNQGRHSLLRRGMLADAIFSGTTGLVLAVAAGPLAELFELPAMMVRIVGLGLLPFSATLLFLVSRLDSMRQAVGVIVAGNLLWVVASVLLLFTGWVEPSAAGIGFIVGQAIIVAGLAEIQFFGLRRSA
jgi:hypothetical protein